MLRFWIDLTLQVVVVVLGDVLHLFERKIRVILRSLIYFQAESAEGFQAHDRVQNAAVSYISMPRTQIFVFFEKVSVLLGPNGRAHHNKADTASASTLSRRELSAQRESADLVVFELTL
jgi:hypothetical protein